MPTFAFQARNKTGERVSGTREADDKRAALEALREAGLFVTQLTPSRGKSTPENRATDRTEVIEAPAEAPSETPAPQVEQPSATIPNSNPIPQSGGAPGMPSAQTPPAPIATNVWLAANAKERSLFFRQMYSMINAGTSLPAADRVKSRL